MACISALPSESFNRSMRFSLASLCGHDSGDDVLCNVGGCVNGPRSALSNVDCPNWRFVSFLQQHVLVQRDSHVGCSLSCCTVCLAEGARLGPIVAAHVVRGSRAAFYSCDGADACCRCSSAATHRRSFLRRYRQYADVSASRRGRPIVRCHAFRHDESTAAKCCRLDMQDQTLLSCRQLGGGRWVRTTADGDAAALAGCGAMHDSHFHGSHQQR
jgi:hypothetical protein